MYYALMLDRKLVQQKKEQIYGTQINSITITDSTTGEKSRFSYVAPIKDPKNVNKRRMEAGFDLTVEENAKRLSTTYKEYTYDDIDQITGQKPKK